MHQKTMEIKQTENETDYKIRTDLDKVVESIASIFEPRLLLCPWRADGICNPKALKMSLPPNALSTSQMLTEDLKSIAYISFTSHQ